MSDANIHAAEVQSPPATATEGNEFESGSRGWVQKPVDEPEPSSRAAAHKAYRMTAQETFYNMYGIRIPTEILIFPPGLDIFAALAVTCINSGQPATVAER